MRGRDLGGTVAEAQQRIARSNRAALPNGYRIEWAGEFEELQQAKARLEVIVPISLVLILVLLYGLFNSLRDSLLALAGIPFSIAGGVSRALRHRPRLQHFGGDRVRVAVRRLGDERHPDHHLLQSGSARAAWAPVAAMYHAAEQRMRPMLMTALSACIGLLPAAISTGIGSQVQRPLATVVVGGMLIGPVIMLVVVPALQTLFLDWRDEPVPATPPPLEEAGEAHT